MDDRKSIHLDRLLQLLMLWLLTSTTCYAYPDCLDGDCLLPLPEIKRLCDGFYLGAALGYDSYRAKSSISITDQDQDTFSASRSASATGWLGGLFVGYGKYFNFYYLGGEVFGNIPSASSNFSFSASTVGNVNDTPVTEMIGVSGDIESKYEYGVGILPGVRVNDSSLFYLRIGYNWVKVQATGTITSNNDVSVAGSSTKILHGFNYGVGIETVIYPNVSIRGEYTYTNYNSINAPVAASYSLSDNQYMLGAIYHFT